MRIISGSKRGKKLKTLEGDKVRPTSDKVKEALFNILQFRVEGRSFLDLFAGSGQIGIEALSRGAKHACFVDVSKKSVDVIIDNIKSTGFTDLSDVYTGSYKDFFNNTELSVFDIIFLDPPFGENLFVPALSTSAFYVKPTGLIICEHPIEEALPPLVGELTIAKKYRYGKIALTLYHRL